MSGDPALTIGDQAALHRNRMAERSRRMYAAVSNIGPIPPVRDPERREACRLNLGLFLQEYFPESTGSGPFSKDHTEIVIPRIQEVILHGGRAGNAVYRGFAKTTISENSALWGTLYGHRRYIALFSSDAQGSSTSLASIKTELAENELLLEDFPEICYPLQSLEWKPQRCASQTYSHIAPCQACHASGKSGSDTPCPDCYGEGVIQQARFTHTDWNSLKVVYPWVTGAIGAGAIISCHSLLSASRGLKHKMPNGKNQRPDMVIIDDPQTDESAASPEQCRKRLNVIIKNLLRLSGHKKEMAAVVNATVIEPDDAVDQLMDPEKYSSWNWVKVPMIREWAEQHDSFWLQRYAVIRSTWDRNIPGDRMRARKAANALYLANREEADKGCVVSWQSAFNTEDEYSAIQHAYNILIDDGEDAFASECQQQPRRTGAKQDDLTIHAISSKAIYLQRGLVPAWASKLVVFCDVQDSALYWLALAGAKDFRAHVVDYGIFPEQARGSLSLKDVRKTLQFQWPDVPKEAAIRRGLDHLSELLAEREWMSEEDHIHRVSRMLVDSADNTDLVYEFTRRAKYASLILPSRGRHYGAGTIPMSEYAAKTGEQLGDHWMISPVRNSPRTKYFSIDTNHWKTFTAKRIQTAAGIPGCLSLFGKPGDHEEFTSHCTAEYAKTLTVTSGRGAGRQVDEWTLRPGRQNHLWDCLVGAMAALSEQGCSLPGVASEQQHKKKRLTQADINAMRERGRRL